MNGVIWMYGVSWEKLMNLANVGYVVNEVIKVNGVLGCVGRIARMV